MNRSNEARSRARSFRDIVRRPSQDAGMLMESLEGRQHRSDTVASQILSSDTLTEASGYLFWGLAIYGGNGQEGPAGVSVGDSSGTLAWGCNVWDSNLQDGFDTGNVYFSFTADVMNTDYMEFETSYSDVFGAYSTASDTSEITMIEIRAAVTNGGMRVAVGTITAAFYSDGVFQDSITVEGPTASRLNQTTTGVKEEILRLTIDEESQYDKVVLTGTFRMQANQGIEPDAEDLVFDVHVYSA
jgi:hypothetical protein